MARDRVEEARHEYFALKSIRTVNTQPSRTALSEEEAAWMENFMPVGPGYLPAVAGPGSTSVTISASSSLAFATINGDDYIFNFAPSVTQAVRLNNTVVVDIAGANTGSGFDQWKSERIVFVSPPGYQDYVSWDGTRFYSAGMVATVSVTAGGSGYTSAPSVVFTGGSPASTASATASIAGGSVISVTLTDTGSGYTSAPSVSFSGGGGTGAAATCWIIPSGMSGSALAVYSGRVWIAKDRTITYSAPGNWVNFNSADAAGSFTLTEPFLRNSIQALKALENYLYIFGDSSIYLLGDVRVTSGITTFSLTVLSSTVGTTFPRTIAAIERSILFANRTGVYAIYGASLSKISTELDGIFPDIDFSKPVHAGLVQVFNILCYALNFYYQGKRNGKSNNRYIQAVYFYGKWFFTSQGDLVSIVQSVYRSGVYELWATTGTDLFPLYQNKTASIATTLITALMPFRNPVLDKQLNRVGVEYTSPSVSTISLSIDTENNIQSGFLSTLFGSALNWVNNSSSFISWINNSGQTITWITSAFLRYDAYSDIVGKYVGFTISSNSPGIVLHGLLGEYTVRTPW